MDSHNPTNSLFFTSLGNVKNFFGAKHRTIRANQTKLAAPATGVKHQQDIDVDCIDGLNAYLVHTASGFCFEQFHLSQNT